MVVDGNFRIEGNAQVTDTSLKGTGYIGGNAELKNGKVEGYIYMDGNAKYIPAAVTNTQAAHRLIMRDNSRVLKQSDVAGITINMELYDNAVVDSPISSHQGLLVMRDNSSLYRADSNSAVTVRGRLEMRDKARVAGVMSVKGDVVLTGDFLLGAGVSPTVTGKRRLANASEITAVELPPTKITW